MKTTTLLVFALCACVLLRSNAQTPVIAPPQSTPIVAAPKPATPSPAATPTPFDALHIAPPPRPAFTPAPPTLAQKQAVFRQRYTMALQSFFAQSKAQYLAILSAATDDESASGGLTPAQKAAALSPAQNSESLTIGWAMANLLNSIQAGSVPNPPAGP